MTMTQSMLARDYDLPKKSTFYLDDMNIVQSPETAAFTPNSVADSVLYGTNGFLGLRHCSEAETVAYETAVFLNGVYHLAPLEFTVDCAALPTDVQTGATVASVTFDCHIDGVSGTLSSIPSRCLSLADSAYRSCSRGVLSEDARLTFDTEYTRLVDMKDLGLWGGEIVYTNFAIAPEGSSESDAGTPIPRWSVPEAGSSDSLERLQEDDVDEDHSVLHSTVKNASGERESVYTLRFMVRLAIDANQWEVLRTHEMDEICQRSLSSSVHVNTNTKATCIVEYSTGKVELIPVVDLVTRTEDFYVDSSPLSPVDTGNTTDFKRFSSASPAFNAHHSSSPTFASFSHTEKGSAKFLVRKSFTLRVTEATLPQRVTLTFMARHSTEAAPAVASFPTMSAVIDNCKSSLDTFWSEFGVDLQLQDEPQPSRTRLSLLYNAFCLFRVSHSLERGLPRGGCSISGEGLQYDLSSYIYHGLYYTITQPSSALALLRSLFRLLPASRQNASSMSLASGALYPTRTITGTNCKQYSNVNSARFHVNAEIGYLINLFFIAVDPIATSDRLMLLEMMLETARIWPQLGKWLENRSVFRLDNIAGPDEYNNCASGSFYIHLSAKMHLTFTLELMGQQEKLLGSDVINGLLDRIKMTRDELHGFADVIKAIFLRQDDRYGVFMVHDSFDTLDVWCKPRAKHPLQLNYHPLAIYRRKLVDIPEVLLSLFLYSTLFDRKEQQRNLSYYQPLCTFDSPESLSLVAIVQCLAYFNFAQPIPLLRSLSTLDLDNIIYAAEEGLHFGAMSCSLLILLCGIGGVSMRQRALHLNPVLPSGVRHYSFTVCWRGSILRTTLNDERVTYELVSGKSIRFTHGENMSRIHLHEGHRTNEARRLLSIPRCNFSQVNGIEGAVVEIECLFNNILEYKYLSWYRILEMFFSNYRTLHHRDIPPLNPEEFIEHMVYEKEENEVSFSGLNKILQSRQIDLALGTPDDAEIVETRFGLANAVVSEMQELFEHQPPQENDGLVALLNDLMRCGVALAMVTFCRSLNPLLARYARQSILFFASITGEEAHNRGIDGRPHVELYKKASEKIHVLPSRTVVFSSHLDRDYSAEDLAQFHMFMDVEDPFVSSRFEKCLYPTVSEAYAIQHNRPATVICPLMLDDMPQTTDSLEDWIEKQLDMGAS